MFKLLMRINYIYSIIWITVTGKDKFRYRDESRFSAWIHSKAINHI